MDRSARVLSRGEIGVQRFNYGDPNVKSSKRIVDATSAGEGETHARAHVSVCPNQQMHLRVGNVCLHLCRHDFRQLANAVIEAMAALEAGQSRAIVH